MEVPDWLMKPTKNNREHITILSLIEHVKRAAERRGADPFLEKQIRKLEKVQLDHARDTVDLDEGVIGEVKEAIIHNKRKAIIIGTLLSALILCPYFVITRTTWFIQRPLLCNIFLTKDPNHFGQIEICVNGVSRKYSPQNGDVELDLTFMRTTNERIQTDMTFWIAEKLGDKTVDYIGEYNTSRVRLYDNGILVADNEDKLSSWVNPVFPKDVRESVWWWVKENQFHYNRDRPPLEERLSKAVNKTGAFIATLGSIGIAVYRFLKAAG